MSSWYESASQVIAGVHADLPKGISFEDRKKAVRAAYPFGPRKYWPYKAWLKAQADYLARYDPSPAGPLLMTVDEAINSSHRLCK